VLGHKASQVLLVLLALLVPLVPLALPVQLQLLI
jgi:hypothetical protein